MRRTAFLLMVAAAAVAPWHAALAAEPGGGFGLKPAHYDPNDRATLSYFKQAQPPGGSFADQVVISNETDQPKTFYVNPVDGLTGETAGSVYGNRNQPLRGAGAWVRADVGQVVVAARQNASVGFTVSVPPNASPGDHLAGIAFQDARTVSSGGQVGVTQVLRGVIGVLVQVSGGARPFSLGISNVGLRQLSPATSQPAILVGLADRGQQLGKPTLSVTLDGPGGYHRSLSRQLDTMLPGDQIRYPFAWPDALHAGAYRACVTGGLPGGQQARHCETLNVAAQYTPKVQPTNTGAQAPPWLWLLVPLVAAGLVGAFLLGRRGRGGGRGGSGSPPWRPWTP